MRFTTKPFIIDAIQWTGQNGQEIQEFVGEHPKYNIPAFNWLSNGDAEVWDHLQETWVHVHRNNWIIKGMKGEFYPCDNEVFQAKYEEA